mgnify:CR=1 FL=1
MTLEEKIGQMTQAEMAMKSQAHQQDLAFKAEGVSIRNAQGVPKAWISRRVGGDQIDYADESPQVRQGSPVRP